MRYANLKRGVMHEVLEVTGRRGVDDCHALIRSPTGIETRVRVPSDLPGPDLMPGTYRLVIRSTKASQAATIASVGHPSPSVSLLTVAIIAAHVDDYVGLLENHMRLACYGLVKDIEWPFSRGCRSLVFRDEDGTLMADCQIGEGLFVKDGSIHVLGTIPETVQTALSGRPLRDLVRHPTFDGLDLVVSAAYRRFDDERWTIAEIDDDEVSVQRALAMIVARAG